MRDTRTLVVFMVMCTTWALVHVYLYRRFRLLFSPRGRLAFGGALVLGGALAPLSMVLARLEADSPAYELFAKVAFFEAGVVAITVVFSVLRDAGLLVAGFARKLVMGSEVDPARRRFVEKVTNVGVLSLSAAIAGTGIFAAASAPEVVRLRIPMRRLPRAFEGYRVVQLSDVHVGPAYRREGMLELVAQVNALDADLVVITGDLIDGYVHELSEHVAPLRELRARDGVLFVTGNHEYYWDAVAWGEHLRGLGLRTLDNEHMVLTRGGERLLVAGCTDHRMGGSLPGQESSPRRALEGAPPCEAKILLAHQPQSVYEGAEAGFDLQLSGHTHGGQFFPFTLIIHLVQPFVRGLSRVGETLLYVNRGTGFWGPALRHGGPGEITVFTLHQGEEESYAAGMEAGDGRA